MSKKVLFIGDIHGLTEWRELALDAAKSFYDVVLLGDYVDSFHVRPVVQIDNLKQIISFLKNKPKNVNVTALIGNHDYAYMVGQSGISGYQFEHAHVYRQLFNDNIDLFQIAWGYRGSDGLYTLATHAGLTQRFWDTKILPEFEDDGFIRQLFPDKSRQELLTELEVHEILNYFRDKKYVINKVGSMRGGVGIPGPLWSDYIEFMEDPMGGMNQVFGHTPKPSVTIDRNGDYFYACIDSWGNKKLASLVLSL